MSDTQETDSKSKKEKKSRSSSSSDGPKVQKRATFDGVTSSSTDKKEKKEKKEKKSKKEKKTLSTDKRTKSKSVLITGQQAQDLQTEITTFQLKTASNGSSRGSTPKSRSRTNSQNNGADTSPSSGENGSVDSHTERKHSSKLKTPLSSPSTSPGRQQVDDTLAAVVRSLSQDDLNDVANGTSKKHKHKRTPSDKERHKEKKEKKERKTSDVDKSVIKTSKQAVLRVGSGLPAPEKTKIPSSSPVSVTPMTVEAKLLLRAKSVGPAFKGSIHDMFSHEEMVQLKLEQMKRYEQQEKINEERRKKEREAEQSTTSSPKKTAPSITVQTVDETRTSPPTRKRNSALTGMYSIITTASRSQGLIASSPQLPSYQKAMTDAVLFDEERLHRLRKKNRLSLPCSMTLEEQNAILMKADWAQNNLSDVTTEGINAGSFKPRSSVNINGRKISVGSVSSNHTAHSESTTEDFESRTLAEIAKHIQNTSRDLVTDWVLSNSLTKHVFQYLEFHDLCSVSMVCSRWNTISRDPDVWHSLYRYYEKQLKKSEPGIWSDLPKYIQDIAAVSEESLYNQQKQRLSSQQNISKLTLDQLVERLTPSTAVPDHFDMNAFLTTYKTFTTTLHLVRKLIERYYASLHVPSNGTKVEDEQWEKWNKLLVRPIQLRVVRVLKSLIDEHWGDLDADSIRLLKVFIRGMAQVGTDNILVRTLVKSFVHKYKTQPATEIQEKEKVKETPSYEGRKRLLSSAAPSTSMLGHNQDIFEIKSKVLAEQLTIIEYEYFKDIKPDEFLNLSKVTNQSKQMDRMISHFNDVSRWVEDMILKEDKPKQRARRMEKLIRTAIHLFEIRNFETMMAITSSLQDYAIDRLTLTKAEVDPKYLKLLEEIEEVMTPDKSYSKYRAKIKEILEEKLPCIPYLGVYRRDLVYIDESTTKPKSDRDTINFGKSKQIFSVIQEIQQFQTIPYNFRVHPAVSARLRALPQLPTGMDYNEYKKTILWELSLKREPKDAQVSHNKDTLRRLRTSSSLPPRVDQAEPQTNNNT